jgi:hypothetical protein
MEMVVAMPRRLRPIALFAVILALVIGCQDT